MPAAEPPGGEGGSGTPGLLSFKSRPGKCQDQPRARTAEQENVLKHTFLGSPPLPPPDTPVLWAWGATREFAFPTSCPMMQKLLLHPHSGEQGRSPSVSFPENGTLNGGERRSRGTQPAPGPSGLRTRVPLCHSAQVLCASIRQTLIKDQISTWCYSGCQGFKARKRRSSCSPREGCPPAPIQDTWQCVETYLVVTAGTEGEGCSWRLVGRGRGGC